MLQQKKKIVIHVSNLHDQSEIEMCSIDKF